MYITPYNATYSIMFTGAWEARSSTFHSVAIFNRGRGDKMTVGDLFAAVMFLISIAGFSIGAVGLVRGYGLEGVVNKLYRLVVYLLKPLYVLVQVVLPKYSSRSAVEGTATNQSPRAAANEEVTARQDREVDRPSATSTEGYTRGICTIFYYHYTV